MPCLLTQNCLSTYFILNLNFIHSYLFPINNKVTDVVYRFSHLAEISYYVIIIQLLLSLRKHNVHLELMATFSIKLQVPYTEKKIASASMLSSIYVIVSRNLNTHFI